MEIELKVGLASEAERQKLLKAFGPAERSVLQRNLFLRDEDGLLAQSRSILRVRREREFPAAGPPVDTVTLALKGDAAPKGALFKREETECSLGLDLEAVERDPSRLLNLQVPPMQRFRELAPGSSSLAVLGGFENHRSVLRVPLQVAGKELETVWEVDRTSFPGGQVDCELEIELEAEEGAGAVLDAVTRRLASAGVLMREERKGKFSRFLTHAGIR